VYSGVIGKTMFCWLNRTIWGSLANHSNGKWKEGTELSRVNGSWDFENSPLSVSTNERCHVDGDCGLTSVSLFKLYYSCLAACGMVLFIYLPNKGVTITRLQNACCLLSSQNGSESPRYIQGEPVLPVHAVECSSISTAPLMSQARCMDILARTPVLLGIGRRRMSILYSATSEFSDWCSRTFRWCSLNLIWIYRPVCPTYTRHTWSEVSHIPGDLSARSSLAGRGSPKVLRGGRQNSWRWFDRTLLRRYNVLHTCQESCGVVDWHAVAGVECAGRWSERYPVQLGDCPGQRWFWP
jgi:hypothetical protein